MGKTARLVKWQRITILVLVCALVISGVLNCIQARHNKELDVQFERDYRELVRQMTPTAQAVHEENRKSYQTFRDLLDQHSDDRRTIVDLKAQLAQYKAKQSEIKSR